MNAFRVLLVLIFTTVVLYTGPVILNHGLNLFEIFFTDIGSMNWPGQFNLDFLGFLILSGFWLAWRHHFSTPGLLLGLLGLFGGAPVLTAYLFYQSFKINGDIAVLLLGEERASNR